MKRSPKPIKRRPPVDHAFQVGILSGEQMVRHGRLTVCPTPVEKPFLMRYAAYSE